MIFTPQQWELLLDKEKSTGTMKNKIARHARAHLSTLAEGVTISTNQLGEALYPRAEQSSPKSDLIRIRLYKILMQLAQGGMADCCMRGEVNGMYFGKPRRPFIWFCPPETELCCMCGQPIPLED